MDCSILGKKGISLLEAIVILLIIGIILSMVLPAEAARIRKTNYEKSIKELTSIAQASIDYFILKGHCPVAISQLEPQFMPSIAISSPFGTNYQMACINGLVNVSVLVPSGLAGKDPQGSLQVIINQGSQDLVEISQSLPNELTTRLSYDLKNQ